MQCDLNPTYRYALDHPGALQAPDGFLQLSGWIAGHGDARTQVRLRLVPGGIFDCRAGEARSDVGAAYPQLSGAFHSGFRLETYVLPGLHVGTLEYRLGEPGDWVPFHTLSVLAGLSPLYAQLECAPPTDDSREWLVNGWCFHPQCEIESFALQFARQQTPLRLGEPRPDVATVYPQFRTAIESGFSGCFPIEPGESPVIAKAKLRNGSVLHHMLLPALKIRDREVERTQQVANKTRAASIKLVTPNQPEVSIVIPIYNQLDFTLGCLESLVRHAGTVSFEVIIIDDRSDPSVAETLSFVPGLRLHSNEKNQGFVLNCNLGAGMARGQYLLFLNNDTEVCTGWLDALIKVFALRPNAGAVGAKLVYPDGRLQEAGGIIWEDGSGLNYGKGDDPERPEYNYLRQVDYCSGACLLVLRQLFLDVGGFDTRYQPAYYEDADLAFAIRAKGREVYYQPAARIIHFEGVSSGTDVRTGVKRHQTINKEKFALKWAKTLQNHGTDSTLQNVARDRYAPSRILVVDACALTPDADSGSLRMFNLLMMLARHGVKVTFAAENLQFYEPYSTQLRLAGVEHVGVPYVFNLQQFLESNAYAFDVIILSRKHVARQFLDLVRRAAPDARIVFDTVDLMFLRLERQAEHEQSAGLQAEAIESKSVELSLCVRADLVFVVSSIEAELLARYIPKEKISLVSNIHQLYPGKTGFAARNGLLFVGGYQHPPNIDAVDFFLDEVLPLIRPRLPSMEVHIIGSNMPDRWYARVDSRTYLHGYVPDLTPLYERVRLAIAPLRYGAGVKGKVNQSMAHGVPVVGTTMAVEGMHLEHGRDVLVADSAAHFAAAVVQLHEDEALWRRIAAGGLKNIKRHFSFAAVEQELLGALSRECFINHGANKALPRRPAAPYRPGERLSFGKAGNARLYAREGWGEPENDSCWIVGNKAVLDMEIPPGFVPSRIKAIVYPFLAAPSVSHQRLGLSVNGRSVTPDYVQISRSEPTELEWTLVPDLLNATGRFSLTLHSPDAIAPRSLGLSSDERHLSLAFLELTIQ